MTDEPEKLKDATPEELEQSLAFALQFNGRKRVHTGDSFMAQITAERLVEHLRMSGYVVKKKPPAPAHSTPDHRPAGKHLTE